MEKEISLLEDYPNNNSQQILSTINEIVHLINKKIFFDIDKVSLNDVKTYQYLNSAKNSDIFKAEDASEHICPKFLINNFQELTTLAALSHSGPGNFADIYIRRKTAKEKFDYMHLKLECVLKETCGIILYKEQIPQIAEILAGFTPSEADDFLKKIDTRKINIVGEQKRKFVRCCKKISSVSSKDVLRIFFCIEAFGGYSAKKEYCRIFAKLAYRMVFLKIHYPKEYACVLKNRSRNKSHIESTETVILYWINDDKL
jgi:DNA polymerase III subunit alpha